MNQRRSGYSVERAGRNTLAYPVLAKELQGDSEGSDLDYSRALVPRDSANRRNFAMSEKDVGHCLTSRTIAAPAAYSRRTTSCC